MTQVVPCLKCRRRVDADPRMDAFAGVRAAKFTLAATCVHIGTKDCPFWSVVAREYAELDREQADAMLESIVAAP